jgi:cellulose synthase/poly-beta-1,6-N-acetylglucosamine synthase-like glycosyltransferase
MVAYFFVPILLISAIYLILALSVRMKIYKKDFFPRVSLISWGWRDGNIIARKIKNFLWQIYPASYEVIIVDNASEDETQRICRRFEKLGLIKYYRTPKPYDRKAFGLDEAIKKVAKHEILAMTDPDGMCERNWLIKMVQPFKDPRVGAVIGLTHAGNFYRNWFTKLRAIEDEWVYVISQLGSWVFGQPVHLVCGANYAVRRKALKDVGYHGKQTLGEDFELTVKLYAKGWRVEVVAADVWQEEVENLREYIRQRLRWYDTAIEGVKIYAKELWRIFRQRPLGLFVYFISPLLPIVSLLNLLMLLAYPISQTLFLLGLFGFFFCCSALIIGLTKVHREFLIPYVPLYLFLEPIFIIYCVLKRNWLKWRGKRVVWRSLYDGYYHRGVLLALR